MSTPNWCLTHWCIHYTLDDCLLAFISGTPSISWKRSYSRREFSSVLSFPPSLSPRPRMAVIESGLLVKRTLARVCFFFQTAWTMQFARSSYTHNQLGAHFKRPVNAGNRWKIALSAIFLTKRIPEAGMLTPCTVRRHKTSLKRKQRSFSMNDEWSRVDDKVEE